MFSWYVKNFINSRHTMPVLHRWWRFISLYIWQLIHIYFHAAASAKSCATDIRYYYSHFIASRIELFSFHDASFLLQQLWCMSNVNTCFYWYFLIAISRFRSSDTSRLSGSIPSWLDSLAASSNFLIYSSFRHLAILGSNVTHKVILYIC